MTIPPRFCREALADELLRRPASADIASPPRSQNPLAAPHRGDVGLGRPGADIASPPRSQNPLAAPHRGGVGLGRPGADISCDPLRPLFASLLAGRALGEGILPATLGLPPDEFAALWQAYFPGSHLRLEDGRAADIPELDDIAGLLRDYRGGPQARYDWMARIVACGCAGRDHLWQDLGLANRGELSALMTAAFPRLAAENTGDMKWKKFIYRQYCARDGIYVCPAPSCGECADYAKCFAPEY